MTSIGRDTNWLVTKWIRLAFLFLASSTVCHSQNTGRLHTFFKQSIGLNDSEIARIEQGKAVAKGLDSSTPSQVFAFGAVFINAQPGGYVRLSGDLDRLKSPPNYLALERFSAPPQLSDLRGFGIEADDVNDLKNCKPGNCELQLPIENIQEFGDKIDWSSTDPVTQVNDLAKKMALEALLAYQKGGNAALGTYRDKKVPAQVSEQFRSLLSRSAVLPEQLATFYSYLLGYPEGSLPDSSSIFYWEKVKFGLKPTLRINQQITAHATGRTVRLMWSQSSNSMRVIIFKPRLT